MPINRIQFQPGLSLPEFLEQFGTEAQCEATLRRAGFMERMWTRFTSFFEITELYEVGFQPKDDVENGFIARGTR